MKKITFISFVLSISLNAGAAEWIFDAAHSNLGFSITHLMVSDITGTFRISSLSITTPNDDFTDAAISMIADVKTIDTDVEDRDEHLKKPDLFDAEKYPDIKFTSVSFKKTGDKKYTVNGNLTMHGVTKPVTLEAVASTSINPYDNKTVAGFRVKGVVKRSDFGIAPTTPEAMLSDEVTLTANIALTKK